MFGYLMYIYVYFLLRYYFIEICIILCNNFLKLTTASNDW